MKAIKPYLALNTPAPATLENSFSFSSTNMAQIINLPFSVYSKYFTQQLLFQLVTLNPVKLRPTCVFSNSKLNVNELKNWNCICCDLVHQGNRSLIHFIICLCWVIISKKLWIVRMLFINCNNYESSSITQIIWFAIVSNRWSDLTSRKQSG